MRLGLLLSQAGEFGFVLFAQAAGARLILPEAASLFGAMVTLSMAATPFLMRLTDWLERREQSTEGPRGAGTVAGNERHRGRLWAVRPDGGADADGQGDWRDADRYLKRR